MQEIRVLAKQIREKKQLLVMESREKNVHGPRMPRTATKVGGAAARPSMLKIGIEITTHLSDVLVCLCSG